MTNSKTPEHLEVCWRVVEGSSTRILTCSIVDAPTSGLELRVGYSADAPLHSRMVADIQSARALAQNWLDSLRAKGDREW